MLTKETIFILQEHQRLLVEIRVLREWLLEAMSAGDEGRRAKMDGEMTRQIDAQLAKTLENLEHVSPALAAALDDRSAAEVERSIR